MAKQQRIRPHLLPICFWLWIVLMVWLIHHFFPQPYRSDIWWGCIVAAPIP